MADLIATTRTDLAAQRCASVGATPATIATRISELPAGLHTVARRYFTGADVEDTVVHRNKLARALDFLTFGPTWFIEARREVVRRIESRQRKARLAHMLGGATNSPVRYLHR